jgi:hypothetical protein
MTTSGSSSIRLPELLIDFITSLDGYAAADGWQGLKSPLIGADVIGG